MFCSIRRSLLDIFVLATSSNLQVTNSSNVHVIWLVLVENDTRQLVFSDVLDLNVVLEVRLVRVDNVSLGESLNALLVELSGHFDYVVSGLLDLGPSFELELALFVEVLTLDVNVQFLRVSFGVDLDFQWESKDLDWKKKIPYNPLYKGLLGI